MAVKRVSKKVGDQKKANKANLLKALEVSLGVVTTACRKANITRRTFYDYLNDDPDFAEAVRDIGEMSIDFAESALFKQISNGNVAATIFYLKTKAKKRGYIERVQQEHTGADGGAIDVTVKTDLSALSTDELMQLKRIQKKIFSEPGSKQ